MMGGSFFGGFGLIGMLLNLIFAVGMIIGIVWLVIWLVRRTGVNQNSSFGSITGEPSAREILQTRYARGEITREQYEVMKQDLG